MNIYYFSGTGNSIAVSRELANHFESVELKPIAAFAGDAAIEDDSEVVGFVVPTYYMDIPDIVKAFVSRLRLRSDAYVFAAVHYGLTPGRAFHALSEALQEGGAKLSLGWHIDLPDNSIAVKTPLVRQTDMLARLAGTVSELAQAVSTRESLPLPGRDSLMLRLNLRIGGFMFRKVLGVDRKRVTEACNLCGLCSDVCPVNDIRICDESVTFGDNCAECFACIHWCPQRAIRFGFLKLSDSSHYTNPSVSASDIKAQKE